MLHKRKIFRDKIKEYLEPIPNINKIYADHPVYLEYADCPVLHITTQNETINTNNVGYPRSQQRTLTFDIALYLKTQNDLQDKMDEFCYEIENAFSLSKQRVKFDNEALTSYFSNIVFGLDETQDRDVAKITYTLEIIYNINENNLSV